jgi:short-subunit dehydrogenase
MSSYNATKAAVLSLSESLSVELRDTNTQVSVVMPTFFRTGLLESFRGPQDLRVRAAALMDASSYSATDVASDVLRFAGRGRTYIPLPTSARMMWRLKRWMPNLFLRLVTSLRERASAAATEQRVAAPQTRPLR